MKKLNKITQLGAGLALALVMTTPAMAVSQTWDGGGDGVLWSSANNWSNNAAPISGNAVTISNSALVANTAMDMDVSGLDLYSLTFTGGSSYYNVIDGYFLGVNNDIIFRNDARVAMSNNLDMNNPGYIKSASDSQFLFDGTWLTTFDNNSLYLATYGTSFQSYQTVFLGNGNLVLSGTGGGNAAVIFEDGTVVYNDKVYIRNKGHLYIAVGNTSIAGKVISDSTGVIETTGCVDTYDLVLRGGFIPNLKTSAVACSGYGRINANGTVDITGANLSAYTFYAPVKGSRYTVINNNGYKDIIGRFAGKPEGSTFKIGTRNFKITYYGGTGNDVVITKL